MFPALRLSGHLLREAKHEAQQLPNLDFLQSFLQKSKFIFRSSPESSRLLLFKPVEDYLLEIEYFSRNPQVVESFYDEHAEDPLESKDIICDTNSATMVFSRRGAKVMVDLVTLNSVSQIASLITTNVDLVRAK